MRNLPFIALSLTLILTLAVACGDAQDSGTPGPTASQQPQPAGPFPAKGPVLETMEGGGYTYVRIESRGRSLWAAGPKAEVKVGDTVTLQSGMAMPNFRSETLDRTFETVYFVGAIVVGEGADAAAGAPSGLPPLPAGHPPLSTGDGAAKPAAAGPSVKVERLEGGQTVEEIVRDAADWSGKEIALRGKVVKFNAGILGKNWLHLQDGTGGKGTNDVTVTTSATVTVGDVVVVRGKVATDRDFGMGYEYAVLVEDATVEKQ